MKVYLKEERLKLSKKPVQTCELDIHKEAHQEERHITVPITLAYVPSIKRSLSPKTKLAKPLSRPRAKAITTALLDGVIGCFQVSCPYIPGYNSFYAHSDSQEKGQIDIHYEISGADSSNGFGTQLPHKKHVGYADEYMKKIFQYGITLYKY